MGPTRPHVGLLAALACVALACRGGASTGPAALEAPAIEHGPPAPYAGTWVGPALRLSFAGPWVLVRPRDDPDAAPIEMRVLVERRQGDAFALRTTLAGVFAADFLRPDDWTMLVEDGQLAIAMGDEPLTPYLADDSVAAPLVGPTMVEAQALPEHLGQADALLCLEHAADACAALEGELPPIAGCRELHWGDCVGGLGPGPADPVERARDEAVSSLRHHLLELDFTRAIVQARPDDPAAATAHTRARAAAAATLATLEAEDAVPDCDEASELRRAVAAR